MSSPPSDRPAPWRTLLATAPSLALAALQVHWCWPFFSDDAFISLRFADRLLHGHGLTWTAGDAVEGYSNLAWVLATAALGGLGLDLVTAARLLGGLCTALGLWLLARAARPHDAKSMLLAALPPLLVAGTPEVMAWTLGGLEGPMAFLWSCWGLGGLFGLGRAERPAPRRLVTLGVPFALLCLTRPDGPLWIAVAAATLLATHRSLRTALALAAPAAIALAAQLAFRLAYHGDFVPNTGRVKVGLSPDVLLLGLEYVRDALLASPGLGAAALLAATWLAVRRRHGLRWLAPPALAWCAYLVTVGGDHFVAYRLFQPVLPALALLVAAACRTGRGRAFAAAALALGIGAVATDVYRARTERLSAMARGESWEWIGKAIGEALGRGVADRAPRIAVDAAGAVPFYSRLPALDMLGLCDRTIARTPVPPWADGAARAGGLVRPQGHTHGNGSYVLDQTPDLIQFAQPPGVPLPVFVSGLELEYDRRFLDGYRLAALVLPAGSATPVPTPVTAWLWLCVEGRAGVRQVGDRLVVPAYLLGTFRQSRPIQCRFERPVGTPEAKAREAAQAEMVAWVVQGRNAAMTPAPDGRFELTVPRAEAVALQLPAALLPDGARWHIAFEPADAPWHAEVVGDTLRATPKPGAALPARLSAVILARAVTAVIA
ncbi:MAG: hypothetical protein U1E73_09090 [Planctomycetota bacterium]